MLKELRFDALAPTTLKQAANLYSLIIVLSKSDERMCSDGHHAGIKNDYFEIFV